MHIPSCETNALEILNFEQALSAANTPVPEYDINKWLYVPNFYSEYRYILGSRGLKPLICVGINPSTAATDPDDMELTYNQQLHLENMKAFEYALSLDQSGAPAVWAAWGTIIEKRDYLPDCVRDMIRIGNRYNANWFSAGKRSKKGHPHHPLYLRKDEKLKPFDIHAYLRNIGG